MGKKHMSEKATGLEYTRRAQHGETGRRISATESKTERKGKKCTRETAGKHMHSQWSA